MLMSTTAKLSIFYYFLRHNWISKNDEARVSWLHLSIFKAPFMQLCTFHGMYRSGTQHKRVPLAYVLMSRRQNYKLRKGPLIACGKIHFWFLKSNLAERLYSFRWRCSHIWLFFIGLNSFQTILKIGLVSHYLENKAVPSL